MNKDKENYLDMCPFHNFDYNPITSTSVVQSLIVSLSLIIEASLEAYFQFWLQSNYSLPDILSIEITNIEELVTYRTLSILLSFVTIAVSIVRIRFNMIYNFSCHQHIV